MTIPIELRGDYAGVDPHDALISHAKGAVPVAYVAMIFEGTVFHLQGRFLNAAGYIGHGG